MVDKFNFDLEPDFLQDDPIIDIDQEQIFGATPPLTQQQKIDAYGPSGRDIISRNVVSGMSNFYDFLAPSEEQLARLRATQAENQKIADQTGMKLTELNQMFTYGDPRGDILADMGYVRPTLSMNLTQGRDFLFGAQKKGFNKLKEGVDFLDLTGEEQFGIILSPLDILDVGGLTFGLKKLAQLGLKKLGPKSTLADAAKDGEIMKMLSDSEAQEIIQKLKPVIDGEQEFLLRQATGKPKKKKQAGTLTTKDEIFPGGLPLKDFDESLLKTKTVKEAPTKAEPKVVKTEKGYIPYSQRGEYSKTFPEGVSYQSVYKPEAENFLKQNYKTMTNKELHEVMVKDPEKYFYSNIQGEAKIPTVTGVKDKKKLMNLTGDAKKKDADRDIATKLIPIESEFNKILPKTEFAQADDLTKATSFEKAFRKAEGLEDELLYPYSVIRQRLTARIKRYNLGKPVNQQIKDYPQINREESPFKKPGSKTRTTVSKLFRSHLAKDDKYKDVISNKELYDVKDVQLKRFFDFIRESSPGARSVKSFDDFLNTKSQEFVDLKNKDSMFYKNYKEFEKIDMIREALSPSKSLPLSRETINIKPFLDRVFVAPTNKLDRVGNVVRRRTPVERVKEAKRSVQIAHRYMGSQIGKTLPEGLEGASELPVSYNLDLSVINQTIQPEMERKARQAMRQNDEKLLEQIDIDAKDLGTEFEIDGRVFGKQLSLQEKLQSLIGPYMGEAGKRLQKEHNITNEMIENVLDAIRLLEDAGLEIKGAPLSLSYGGMVEDDLDIFEEQSNDLPEGSFEVASLKLPFFKLFGKAPVNEVAPIPTPKEKLANQTKKQKESLDREKEVRSQEDIFDPTPSEQVELDPTMPVAVTPITNQPMTSVFYSDIERAMTNAPEQFANKQEVLDFLNKNRIKKSEVDDYRIAALLKLYDDTSPIAKTEIISQVRSAPISGMRVHGTGSGSEIINPNGAKDTRYKGYAEDGLIPDTQRERVLYINRDKLPGDTGEYPQSMFGGETIQRHDFGIPNEENTYIVGWTRLSDRYGFVPPKVEGPQTKINVRQLTREKTKNERSLQGLYAEARSKIERLANQRGMSQRDINDIDIDFGSDIPKLSVIAKYADQLDEISPGLVNQMDELVVRNRDLQEQITKASGVDPSGVVRVTFADEIQSDLLQAAAGRKQQLAAALRKIQEDGAANTNLQGLNRVAQATIDFYEKNKSVFRPLTKTEGEVDVIAQRINKLETEVDNIVNNYIATREIDQTQIDRLAGLLNDNINNMLDEVLSVDSNTMAGLFPDLPFKNREEWADALIKKDLYELAYRKFVLKDPDASAYYAVSPSKYVSKRYNFTGDASTSAADRAADKQRRFDAFKRNGQFIDSQYKGIGMDEFYGGPDSVSNVIDNSGTAATNPNFGKPKHYTSTIETILKKQAQSNNSEMIIMPVQLKSGRGTTQYRVTDQNGNMVATLTNEDQARQLLVSNANYRIQPISIPNKKDMEPVFAIKITPEMLEPYKTHKAQGGLVEHIDIFEV